MTSEENARHFRNLKEKLTTSEDFGAIMTCFMDTLCENPGFFDLGVQVTEHPALEAALAVAGGTMVKGNVVIQALLMVHLAEHQFVHGGFLLGGRIAQFFYFEDIQMGLLAVAMSLHSGQMQFARFAASPMRRDPSLN